MVITMASYTLQRHLWWRTQSRLGQNNFQKVQKGCFKRDIQFDMLAQAALRAAPEVALQCVAGHCYYTIVQSLSTIKLLFALEYMDRGNNYKRFF